MRITNIIEKLHLAFKRTTKKIGAFTGDNALMRFAVSILIDINEGVGHWKKVFEHRCRLGILQDLFEITAIHTHYRALEYCKQQQK